MRKGADHERKTLAHVPRQRYHVDRFLGLCLGRLSFAMDIPCSCGRDTQYVGLVWPTWIDCYLQYLHWINTIIALPHA